MGRTISLQSNARVAKNARRAVGKAIPWRSYCLRPKHPVEEELQANQCIGVSKGRQQNSSKFTRDVLIQPVKTYSKLMMKCRKQRLTANRTHIPGKPMQMLEKSNGSTCLKIQKGGEFEVIKSRKSMLRSILKGATMVNLVNVSSNDFKKFTKVFKEY